MEKAKYYKLFDLNIFLHAFTFATGIQQKVFGVINFKNLAKMANYQKI